MLMGPRPSTVTATQARGILYRLIGQVCEDSSAVTITSKAGNAVLISERDWQSIQETAHLLRSRSNVRRLLDSLDALDAGQGQVHDLVDPE